MKTSLKINPMSVFRVALVGYIVLLLFIYFTNLKGYAEIKIKPEDFIQFILFFTLTGIFILAFKNLKRWVIVLICGTIGIALECLENPLGPEWDEIASNFAGSLLFVIATFIGDYRRNMVNYVKKKKRKTSKSHTGAHIENYSQD